MLSEDDGVPTLEFLESCRAAVPFFSKHSVISKHSLLYIRVHAIHTHMHNSLASCSFSHICHRTDTLSSTAFAPVKADINGNIEVYLMHGLCS